jgi:hypothetical protein
MRIAALAMVAAIAALTLPNQAAAQEQPAGVSPAPPSTAETGSALIKDKLHSMILEKVNFDKMDIVEVIHFLAAKSKELDPDKEGINFVMGDPANFAPEDHVHREVSIVLDSVPMDELLGYITEQTNLQYRVDDYAVYLHPAVDQSETLSIRVYKVPPNFFSNTPAPSGADGK